MYGFFSDVYKKWREESFCIARDGDIAKKRVSGESWGENEAFPMMSGPKGGRTT